MSSKAMCETIIDSLVDREIVPHTERGLAVKTLEVEVRRYSQMAASRMAFMASRIGSVAVASRHVH